jgi:exopolysaccharide biosynthesis WecB/TagA/CpsF family protein
VSRLRALLRLPERGLATGAAWMLAAQGIRLLAQAVYFVLLARRLGADGFGAFAAALGSVSLAVPFAGLGAGSFLIRGVTRGERTPDHWWGRAVLTVLRGGSVLGVAVVGLGWLVLHGRLPLSLLVGVTISDVMLLPLIEVSGQAFQALDRLDRTALVWVVWSVLKVAAAVALTIDPGGSLALWAFLYPLSTASAALVAVVNVTRRVGWPAHARSFGRAELREGLLFSLSGSARSIYDDIDKTMLARFDSLGVTGVYGAAYRIIDVAFLPVRSLVFAAYPRFFARGAAGVRAVAQLARGLVPAAAGYSLAAGAGLFLLAPLAPLALGPTYAGVGDAIRWLAILPLLRAMHYFAADALTGAGHQEVRTGAQIGVALLNICLNLILIPRFSWVGAAWASIASDGSLAVSLWLALLVLARRSPGHVRPPGAAAAPQCYRLLGVSVHALTAEALSAAVVDGVEAREHRIIANHNLHSIYLHHRDDKFRAFYERAYLVHVDGMSLIFAGRILGIPLRHEHRITYVDWLDPLMATARDRAWRVLFVGSDEAVGARGVAELRRRHPGLMLDAIPGYFDPAPEGEANRLVLQRVRAFAPHLLMVGMGMPRQEHWILDNLERFPACVILTAGGAMGYPAGMVPTPPRWAGGIGLEWAFRLLAEPRRLWRRYLLEPWPVLGVLLRELVVGPRQAQ